MRVDFSTVTQVFKTITFHLVTFGGPPTLPRGAEEWTILSKKAVLRACYSSTFHFQSGHTFVTQKLLKARFQGILCRGIHRVPPPQLAPLPGK